MAEKTPKEKWHDLKLDILIKIQEIDAETACNYPGQDVEPQWWIEMMNIRRALFMNYFLK